MSENPMTKDVYERELERAKGELEACQRVRGWLSEAQNKGCYECQELLECATRKSYVSAVYKSMNKGQVGDFDF
ncbi:hypothetical protein BKN38_04630 [Helicobacter sp. CLO-3]|uniref:hypothetical protein n=1 Tax=unclassified Helicobacter TaxID=2593540 RepID=UPI000804AD95|nr:MULTISPECIES: hypothetical protein [unclassified Helicobacter]OBV29825.1 hypothetical protein BA723_04125 [Helicobacter sp. CLO-3]OHU83975.1 hypothetical protein BKN38_04630 [Helicobacter sp. CLO-3]